MSEDDRICVIIPTYERPVHLYRKLDHFATVGCAFPVKVYDSSSPEVQEKNATTVAAFADVLRVEHVQLPRTLGYSQKIFSAVTAVETPYVVVHSDDDYLNLVAVGRCVAFLEENRAYVSATGFTLELLGPSVASDFAHDITVMDWNDVRDEPDPMARGYATRSARYGKIPWYNVWRRDKFVEILTPICRNPYKKYTEVMLYFLAAFCGPTKRLDELYEVRIPNYEKASRREHSVPQFESGITSALLDQGFFEDMPRFVETCSRLIQDCDPGGGGPRRDEIIRLYLGLFAQPQKLLPAPSGALHALSNNRLVRGIEAVLRRARHLPRLMSLRHLVLFCRMLKLYGFGWTGHMLRTDPAFRYNIVTLSSGRSDRGEAFRAIYAALKKDLPERLSDAHEVSR